MSGPLVFLDRDGTLIVDRHYLADPDGVDFAPTAIAGLRLLQSIGARLFVVTNQSGVARGYFPYASVEAIHREIDRRLAAQGLAPPAWYVCPHGPGDGCDCRKPRTGLALRACREHGLDPAGCFAIGDKVGDARLGMRIGGTGILIRPDQPTVERRGRARRIAAVRDFESACRIVERRWLGQASSAASQSAAPQSGASHGPGPDFRLYPPVD